MIRLVETDWGKVAVYDRQNLDCISATVAGNQFWDGPLLLPFYDKYSHPDKVAIEVGAFNGQSSVYLSKRNRHVIAVEPVHDALVEATLNANGVNNVTLLRGAAWSEGCWLLPAPDKDQGQPVNGLKAHQIDNPGGVALMRATTLEAESVECIQGVRLDKWVDEHEVVSLVKSDAQGADLLALMGMKGILEKHRPPVLFEFEEHLAAIHGHTWRDYQTFFKVLEYGLEEQDGVGYPRNFVALPK